jgi:hypothetical protein
MKITATTLTTSNTRMVIVIAMLVLSGLGMFGQTVQSTVVAPTVAFETVVANQEAATANLSFVSWFMGTKQTTNSNSGTDVSDNAKKQMIQSGIAPNRLLLKTFYKKAANYATNIA